MSRPEKPDTRDAQMAEFDRRLKALEVGGRAEHTTMQGGLFRIRDVGGTLRAAMGDLDGDGNVWGFEIVQGGVIRIRDEDGTVRAVIGDVDETDAYGLDLHEGGIMRVRDGDDALRAAIGDLDEDGSTYGFEVNRGGIIRIRDEDGAIRALLGDLRDDGTLYGFELVEGGILQVRDPDDLIRVKIGDLDGAGNFGVEIYDADGGRRFGADSDGLKDPYLSWQMVGVTPVETVTAGTWTRTHSGLIPLLSHKGVGISLIVSASPGTTGEVRLRNVDSGTSTDPFSFTGPDSVFFGWLHGQPLGADSFFEVQAQVTAGGGQVGVYDPPGGIFMLDPQICTATGLP